MEGYIVVVSGVQAQRVRPGPGRWVYDPHSRGLAPDRPPIQALAHGGVPGSVVIFAAKGKASLLAPRAGHMGSLWLTSR